MAVLLVYTAGSLLSLCVMYYIREPLAVRTAAFGVGFFAAGGALQSGLALFGEFFPSKKGRNLGMYYSFIGLAAYAGPAVSSWLLRRLTDGLEAGSQAYKLAEITGKAQIVLFDVGVAAVGVALMLVIGVRYCQVFGVSPFTLKKSCALPEKEASSTPEGLEQAR